MLPLPWLNPLGEPLHATSHVVFYSPASSQIFPQLQLYSLMPLTCRLYKKCFSATAVIALRIRYLQLVYSHHFKTAIAHAVSKNKIDARLGYDC